MFSHFMLKKAVTLSLLLALASVTAFSQEAPGDKINWIEKLKAPLYNNIDILKMDSSVLIYQCSSLIDETMYGSVIMIGAKKMVYRVDLKTNQTIEKDTKCKDLENPRKIEKIAYFNNEIHLISSFEDKANKKYYVYDQTLNAENLEENNDLKKVVDIDYSKWGNVYTGLFSTTVEIKKSRILISTSVQKKGGYNNVFNILDLNMVQKASYSIEELDAKQPLNTVQVDNEDNLYTIKYQEQTKDQCVYTISLYMKGMETPKRKMLQIQDRTTSFTSSVNQKNELVCAGLCNKLGKQSAIGAFTYIFPPLLDGEGKKEILSFSEEFLTKDLDKKEASKVLSALKKNKEINNKYSYSFDKLHFNEDGTFSFITEKQKIKRKVSRSSTGVTTETYYFTFGDIYIFSCNADGSFKWSENVKRELELSDDGSFAGYHLTHYGNNDELSLIINNSSIKGKSLLSTWGKEPKTMMYTYDQKGEKTNQLLFTDKKSIETMVLKSSKNIDNNRIIFVRIKETILPPSSTFLVGELKL